MIDLVVTWVNGNDPEWMKEKEKYDVDGKHNGANRYRDWGLMKYWFRSVSTCLPWVHKIHFVTWGHVPDFLNTEHEKIHIVNHRDILPSDVLPTYNSMAIEANLHRIPGLAEQFIYLNDDVFFIKPIKEEDLFYRNLPQLSCIEMPLRNAGEKASIYQFGATGLINRNFRKKNIPVSQYPGKMISTRYSPVENIRNIMMKICFPEYFAGFKIYHGPGLFLKSTFEEVWEKEKEIMTETTSHRFRHDTDINQWAFTYWQMASMKFHAQKNRHAYIELKDNILPLQQVFESNAQSVCINDPDSLTDFKTIAQQTQEEFEKHFPNKCEFEKTFPAFP